MNSLKRVEDILNIESADSDQLALICYDSEKAFHRVSYQQLRNDALQFEKNLQSLGILPGDRVVLCAKNIRFWIPVFFACLLARVTPVLVDPSLPEEERLKLYALVEPRLIIQGETPSYIASQLWHEGVPVLNLSSALLNPFGGFSDYIESPVTQDPNTNVAAIVLTSGTTNCMQAVMLSHESLIFTVENLMSINKSVDHEIVFNPLPLYHIYPLSILLKTICNRHTYVTASQFSPAIFRKALHENAITTLVAVPRLLERMMLNVLTELESKPRLVQNLVTSLIDHPSKLRKLLSFPIIQKIRKKMMPTVEYIATAGSSVDAKVMRFFSVLGIPVLNGYGLSETAGGVTATTPDDLRDATVGKPLPGVDVMIEHDAAGELGSEICVKSPGLMLGYFRNAAETQKCLTDSGYFKTGDLGYLDLEGHLVITGRKKELIVNPDGKKVLCSQLDQFYAGVEGVKEQVCVGLPVGTQGNELPHIVVVLDDAANSDLVKNTFFQKATQAPSHWQIVGVHFVDEIPKTSIGKVKRVLLKSQLISDEGISTSNHARTLSPNEIAVLAIWKRVLKLPSIALDTPFLSLGGGSLAAMEIYEALQKEFLTQNIMLENFLEADTIEKQAKLLEVSYEAVVQS